MLVRARPRRRRSKSSSNGVLQQQHLLNLVLQNSLLLTLLLFNPLVSQKFAKKSKLLFCSDIQLPAETLFFFFFFLKMEQIIFFYFFYFYLRVFLVRTYVFHLLGTYVILFYNWFILWQNVLYLYLGRFMMRLNTSKNNISRSSVIAFKSVQENKLIVQIH